MGPRTFWHSSAHLMAEAIEALYPGTKFGIGPAIENGFYYDIEMEYHLNDDDLKKIEDEMLKIIEPCVRNSEYARRHRH